MQKELRVVKLSDVEVSDRARKDYGDIEGLMNSIRERQTGLIQPVFTSKNPDPDGRPYLLEAGGRRFKAHELIGAETIETIYYPDVLTDEERKRTELEENTQRKNLEWQEETELTRKIVMLGNEIAKVEGRAKMTQQEAASLLGKNQSTISRDLELAEAMKIMPELSKCESKKDAIKMLDRTKERLIAQKLSKRKEAEIATTDIAKVRATLRRCYIVRDFFQGIKDVKDGILDFVEMDPDYGINFSKIMQGSADGPAHYSEDYNEFSPEEYETLIRAAAKECYRVLKDDTWLICWHSFTTNAVTSKALADAGFEVKPFPLIWCKPGISRTMFPEHTFKVDYEGIIYARKGKAMLVSQAPSSLFTHSAAQRQNRIHPTEKPIKLLEELFSNFIDPGGSMMSAFLGSGNSIFAATNIGVKCFGFDLSEAYKNDFSLRVDEWSPKTKETKQVTGPVKTDKNIDLNF